MDYNRQEWKWLGAFLVAAMRETGVQSLGQEDHLDKEMATHPLQYSFLKNSMDTGPWQATEFNSDDHDIHYCGWESFRKNGVALIVNKKVQKAVLGTWTQSQKLQNNLSSVPRQSIQYHSNPSLCLNHWHGRSWSWPVMKTYKTF